MKKEKYFRLNKEETEALAQEYGTPLLVLSLEQIEKNYRLLRTHLPRVKVFYAIKANPHRRILELMRDLGSNFDVASDGEIMELSSLGVDGSRMIYANPMKTVNGLRACRNAGVGKMTFGGLGCNPFNPALVGRIFLLISFPVQMTSWPLVQQWGSYTDAETGATPLALMKMAVKGDANALGQLPDTLSLFLGNNPGSLGEVSALALLLGLGYMLWKKIIS